MLVSPGSPEGPCVDAARDSMYCPQEAQAVPRAAPRGNLPTPKPRSGNEGVVIQIIRVLWINVL